MTIAVPGLRFFLLAQVSWITDNMLERMAKAYELTGAECARDHNKPLPTTACASRLEDIPDEPNVCPIFYKSTIDVPGDAAYHDFFGGRPHAVVLAAEGISLEDVQLGGDHEQKEAIVDVTCDVWITLPDGTQIPLEVADPTEDDRRLVDLGDGGDPVVTSNYVLPSWFDPTALPGSRFDALGLIDRPLMIRPGGYAQRVTPAGNLEQVGEGPAAHKIHPAFRYGRRFAQAHARATGIRATQRARYEAPPGSSLR